MAPYPEKTLGGDLTTMCDFIFWIIVFLLFIGSGLIYWHNCTYLFIYLFNLIIIIVCLEVGEMFFEGSRGRSWFVNEGRVFIVDESSPSSLFLVLGHLAHLRLLALFPSWFVSKYFIFVVKWPSVERHCHLVIWDWMLNILHQFTCLSSLNPAFGCSNVVTGGKHAVFTVNGFSWNEKNSF